MTQSNPRSPKFGRGLSRCQNARTIGAMVVLGFCSGPGVGALEAATVALPSAPSGFSGQPSAPSGFTSGSSSQISAGSLGDQILEGFSFLTSMAATYDSNVTQSPGPPIAPIQDDLILTLGGSVNYHSTSSGLTFGGNYHGAYNEYFAHSDFSGYSQGAGAVANYDAGRLKIGGQVNVGFDRGSNRNYASSFVEQTSINSSISASYRLSPKTSLAGNLSQGYTTTSGGYNEQQSLDFGVSGLWRYSPLTELGPGVRYTYRTGGAQDGRTSIGPTVSLNYKLSTKVSLNSRVGVDFASYENAGSADPTFSASIGLNYQASRLWGMNFSFFRDTQSDPSVSGGYYETTAIRLGYTRKIQRASLNLGVSYETTSYSIPVFTGVVSGNDPIPTAAPDRKYLSLDGSLGMLILSNTSYASIFVRYTDQSGGGTGKWDSVQTGLSIARSF